MDPDDEAFEVSQEALLNTDFDDEATFSPSEDEDDPDELNNLEVDADIPLEQLRAMYGYGPPVIENVAVEETPPPESDLVKTESTELGAAELVKAKNVGNELAKENSLQAVLPHEDEASPIAEEGWPATLGPEHSSLFNLAQVAGDDNSDYSSSSSSDEDYKPAPPSPSLDWRKEIRLGDEYQAEIPQLGAESTVGVEDAREEGTLVWEPGKVSEAKVSDYLSSALTILNEESSAPASCSIDGRSEWALQHLLKCEHNCEEALKQLPAWESPVTPWTEEECSNFEHGLRIYGKNFYLIHKYEVSHRSIGELIQFYYLWKKTERHDYFRRTYAPRHGRKRTTGPSDFDGQDYSESDSDSQLADSQLATPETESDSQLVSAASSMLPSPRAAQSDDVNFPSQDLARVSSDVASMPDVPTISERPAVEASNVDDRLSKRLSPVVLLPEAGALPFVVTCESESVSNPENGMEDSRTKSSLPSQDVHNVDEHDPQPTPPHSPLEPPCKKLFTG